MNENDKKQEGTVFPSPILYLLSIFLVAQNDIAAYSKERHHHLNVGERARLQNVQANHPNIFDHQNVHLQNDYNTIPNKPYATTLELYALVDYS